MDKNTVRYGFRSGCRQRWAFLGDRICSGGVMTFPTYDGKKDRTLGRTMLEEVNGPNGIRTRISKNADGSTTRLRTRNGMPEFVTLQEEEDGVRVRRGFVAYVRGAKYGALFDPYTLTVLDPKYTLVGAL